LTLATALFACVDAGEPQPEADVAVERVERTATGQPFLLAGDLGRLAPEQLGADAELTVPTIRTQMNLTSTSELHVRRVEHDDLGMTHVRVSQRKHGLRVVSGEAI